MTARIHVLAVLGLFFLSTSCTPGTGIPLTPLPRAPVRGSCDLAGLPMPLPTDPALVLPAGAKSGGTFQGSTANISSPIELTTVAADLIIITDGALTIGADITFAAGGVPRGQVAPNILLVSRNGTVTVAAGVTIGSAMASQGADGVAAAAGTPGGRIHLIGAVIRIDGRILGHEGGRGGNSLFAAGMTGGGVSMKAGNGAPGGTVNLCASEVIAIGPSALVLAGQGGQGGVANIDASSTSSGVGGTASNGGDVVISGTDPHGGRVQVSNLGRILGGHGGMAGYSFVDLRSGARGNATARSGNGGTGGGVVFKQANVVAIGIINAGNGGFARSGSGLPDANAHGGNAPGSILFAGRNGGNATAVAGNGGAPGPQPKIPTPAGIVPGGLGQPGPGGDASADPGDGGNAGSWSATGGSSGTSSAQGGSNGAGAGPGAPVTVPAIPPVGKTGGIGPAITQSGTP